MPYLSIVSPVYNTGSILPALVGHIHEAMKAVTDDYEVILVDDGSPDNAWESITKLCAIDRHMRGIRLSRNFGQHAALSAGLAHTGGDWVVVMDSDLQDLPGEIVRLHKRALTGFEIVMARRADRKDNFFRRAISRLFYLVLTKWSGLKIDYLASNFGIYSRRVIREVLRMQESIQFFPMMVSWTGFARTSIDVRHGERAEGRSGYNFRKLYRLALNATLAYSDKPLRYVVKAGLTLSLLSFLFGLVTLIRYLHGDILVSGYTSLIISIWFLGGLLMFTLGVVGLYVGKTFEEVKKRPRYIIEQVAGHRPSNGAL